MTRKRFVHECHGHLRDHESDIVRRLLFFSRTSGVDVDDYKAIKSGVQKIIDETGRRIQIRDYGDFSLHNGNFGSTDWYQREALTRKNKGLGRQVSAGMLDHLLRTEPYQQQTPHFDFFVVDKDLTTHARDIENNLIFGYGPYPNNIVSTRRFRKYMPDSGIRQISLAVLAAHEIGHNLDLVGRNFNIGTDGYTVGHCNGEKGPCLMEQVNVPGQRTISHQARLLVSRSNWLCPDCTDEVRYKRRDLKSKGVHW